MGNGHREAQTVMGRLRQESRIDSRLLNALKQASADSDVELFMTVTTIDGKSVNVSDVDVVDVDNVIFMVADKHGRFYRFMLDKIVKIYNYKQDRGSE